MRAFVIAWIALTIMMPHLSKGTSRLKQKIMQILTLLCNKVLYHAPSNGVIGFDSPRNRSLAWLEFSNSQSKASILYCFFKAKTPN